MITKIITERVIKLFCTKCGNQLADDSKFCSNCGNVVGEEQNQIEKQGQVQQTGDVITAATDPKEEGLKDKKQKSKWAVLAIVIAVVLALGFIAKDFLVYAVSPEKFVLSAINKTYKDLCKDLEKMRSMFSINTLTKTSSTSNIKFLINNIQYSDDYYEDLNMLNGMGIELTTGIDRNKKELVLCGKAVYDDSNVLSINSKLDDNELLVNIPELYHKSFTVPSKDFGKQWNNSIIAMKNDAYVDDSLDISFSEIIEKNTLEKIDKRTKREYLKGFKTLIQNASYEKNGSEYLYIGDKSKKCQKTTVKLNNDDVKDGLIQLIDALNNDNRIEQWKNTFRNTDQYYVIQDFEETINEMRYGINEYYDIDNITFDVYTKNGNVVQLDFILISDMEYKEENLKGSIAFLGEKNLIDDFKFELIPGNGEEFKMIVSSKGDHLGNKNLYTDDTRISINSYGIEVARINFNTEVDLSKAKDNYKSNIDLISDEVNMQLNIKGDFTSSSKKIEYNLKDVSIELEDDYGDSFIFQGALSLSEEEGVKNLDDFETIEKLDLVKITEDDIYEIMVTIEENVENIVDLLGLY